MYLKRPRDGVACANSSINYYSSSETCFGRRAWHRSVVNSEVFGTEEVLSCTVSEVTLPVLYADEEHNLPLFARKKPGPETFKQWGLMPSTSKESDFQKGSPCLPCSTPCHARQARRCSWFWSWCHLQIVVLTNWKLNLNFALKLLFKVGQKARHSSVLGTVGGISL